MFGGIMSQMAHITDFLFLSGARAVTETNIRGKGITCIVNATRELPCLPLSDVDYLKIPVEDLPTAPISDYFHEVSDKIYEVKKKGGKTLVHCIAGVSRSASLCVAYLIKYEGLTLRQAYHHIKGKTNLLFLLS
ncbi:unnamed protein product [Darwinula stevensoni]|uniref:protein-serine/threonine phosphatase n=1 Tax=Darwinula stevensoni TaxID=69355 RepID=A0A7R8ZZI3_9CRUS|nr:unnamed protein product [Darwinula stevensoni]CAG0883756.1 unnamed protein product [Darwinula stevensoni]